MENRLWYKDPPSSWKEGLPLGNGRIAVMVCGEPGKDRFALNHEGLWRGKYRNRDNGKKSRFLPEIRRLLLEEEYEKAAVLANDAFGGGGGKSKKERRVDSYQPAGDLYFIPHGTEEHYSDYRRDLNLDTAVVSAEYTTPLDGVKFEALTHFKEDLFFLRVLPKNGRLSGDFQLDRIPDPDCRITFEPAESALSMKGKFIEGIEFSVDIELFVRGGSVKFKEPNSLTVEDAEEAAVVLNVRVDTGDFADDGRRAFQFSFDKWESLKMSHAQAYRSYFNRMSLLIDSPVINQPTDERLAAFRSGTPDAGIPILYHNFGRYLFCSSSGIGSLPPNLQGKWNEELSPPWNCDYHNDINLQMNHWSAEAGNLGDLVHKLFRLYSRFFPHAKKAAADLYDCGGIWLPIQTDPWGRATPESYGWAVWIGAAPWLAQHYWLHYEYSQDENYLAETAYPFLKETAAFYEDYLVEDENGVLQIMPSQSPENKFKGSGELPVSICISSSMDVQLALDVFDHCIGASEILGLDPGKRENWKSIRSKLPELRIGSDGRLLEWNKEFEEAEPRHRHISHLYGLYPGDLFSRKRTPELYNAAVKSLEKRLETGGGHTGWSRAWTACCFARTGDRDRAYKHLKALICDFATDSMLDLHPPRIFQIEGNLGGTAAVIEMLFQSYYGELHFLPALPREWRNGRVLGMKARGGYEIDFEWKEGQLTTASLVPNKDGTCAVKELPENVSVVRMSDEAEIPWEREGELIRFPVAKDIHYRLSIT